MVLVGGGGSGGERVEWALRGGEERRGEEMKQQPLRKSIPHVP